MKREAFPEHLAEPFRPAVTAIQCPACKSKSLTLTESGVLNTTWTVSEGKLNRSAGNHEPGTILQVTGKCDVCGHTWRLRRARQITDCVLELNPATFKPI